MSPSSQHFKLKPEFMIKEELISAEVHIAVKLEVIGPCCEGKAEEAATVEFCGFGVGGVEVLKTDAPVGEDETGEVAAVVVFGGELGCAEVGGAGAPEVEDVGGERAFSVVRGVLVGEF